MTRGQRPACSSNRWSPVQPRWWVGCSKAEEMIRERDAVMLCGARSAACSLNDRPDRVIRHLREPGNQQPFLDQWTHVAVTQLLDVAPYQVGKLLDGPIAICAQVEQEHTQKLLGNTLAARARSSSSKLPSRRRRTSSAPSSASLTGIEASPMEESSTRWQSRHTVQRPVAALTHAVLVGPGLLSLRAMNAIARSTVVRRVSFDPSSHSQIVRIRHPASTS